MPREFSQIWTEARRSLLETPRWIVCRYSLPHYDIAMRRFFAGILSKKRQALIVLLDPDSAALAERWRELSPKCTHVQPFPGLPQAFDHDWRTVGRP
jgi:hypothetical protein